MAVGDEDPTGKELIDYLGRDEPRNPLLTVEDVERFMWGDVNVADTFGQFVVEEGDYIGQDDDKNMDLYELSEKNGRFSTITATAYTVNLGDQVYKVKLVESKKLFFRLDTASATIGVTPDSPVNRAELGGSVYELGLAPRARFAQVFDGFSSGLDVASSDWYQPQLEGQDIALTANLNFHRISTDLMSGLLRSHEQSEAAA